MTDVERVPLRLVYAGRRIDSKDRLTYAWIPEAEADPAALLNLYTKLKGSAIGGIYTVDASDAEGSTVYAGTLRYTGEVWPGDRTEWVIRDMDARQRSERAKSERALAKRTDVDRALEPLESLAARLRTSNDLHALQQILTDRLYAAYWKARG